LGNVWEWVHDQYGDSYYAESPAVDPTGAGAETQRSKLSRIRHPKRKAEDKASRGSSWYWNPKVMRVSARHSYAAGYADYCGGFRCVLEAQ
jgi:formylglycine-generating enzyme required for sulfatase activity